MKRSDGLHYHWKSLPLGGLCMERVKLHAFYELGYSLHPIAGLRGDKTKMDLWVETIDVMPRLDALLRGSPVKLRNEQPVTTLIEAIKDATKKEKTQVDLEWLKEKAHEYKVREDR